MIENSFWRLNLQPLCLTGSIIVYSYSVKNRCFRTGFVRMIHK